MRPHSERGEVTTFQAAVLTILFALAIAIGLAIYLGLVINHGTDANTAETQRVAKCSFQFSAYRAQYSQASNSSLRPVEGLEPYAGLELPPAADIKAHLADNCQQYLVPFTRAAKAGP